MGLAKADLEARLGRPSMVRLEHPAEVWQYRGEACVFDLFLYPEDELRRVIYFEARDLDANPVEARGCLRRFLLARLGKAAA